MKRCCKYCRFFNSKKWTCNKGGHSEIGEPEKERSKEDCNAWKPNKEWKKVKEMDTEKLKAIIFKFAQKEIIDNVEILGKQHPYSDNRVDTIGELDKVFAELRARKNIPI